MEIGGWTVRTLLDGTFALDGGSMFGVVPRALWQREREPDDRNRIPLASRLLLLTRGERVVLVDTGLGDRWTDKERDIYAIRRHAGGVVAQLDRLGIAPHEVTDVLLTHLHFDHAAGTVSEDATGLGLTFPRARHHLQRRQWEWAQAPSRKDRASFRSGDFELLGDSPALRLHEGDVEIAPGLSLLALDGHTYGMQAVRLQDEEECLLYAADLVPTATHVRLPFIMAYDNQPLTTLAEKERLLSAVADGGWLLVLEHDPDTPAVRLRRQGSDLAVAETVEI